MRQGQARERLADVAHLRGGGPQELAAHRRVVEQVARPRCACRARRSRAGRRRVRRRGRRSRRRTARRAAAIAASPGRRRRWRPAPRRGSRGCAMRNRSSASWSLLVAWLAKASGRSSAWMPQPSSTTRISSTAALLDVDVDAAGAGIDGVFQQLLDDAGRPFDDLAGGDLVDDQRAAVGGYGASETFLSNGRSERFTRHASPARLRRCGVEVEIAIVRPLSYSKDVLPSDP